ncbi:hypothetical protein PIB30_009753 [Stylosanthes scabra]|uniref:Uncharacterized protein n=1 Tax=Stylosanthes scabra TaxID=79078 RepID=A0ABU6X2M1_9FABA|nr:hypothetical protein [Stylosanthes scabra]
MRDALKHLLNLPPGEGVSSRTMSMLQKLSTSFDQWSMDYHNGIGKIKAATECMSKAEKAKEGFIANAQDFKDIVTYEKALCNKLATLEQKKTELEQQINVITVEIARFKRKRENVTNRKREVFEDGKVLRSERDGLGSQVPRLEAEKELTKAIEANIEAEWSKLGKEVLQSTSFV